jgi:hypothetical protein
MRELISHPGLQFYISRLEGKLSYDLTIQDKPAKKFELCSADFEGVNLQEAKNTERSLAGTDASAVGLEIKLVRNDGILNLEYAGEGGSTAKWTFRGLQETGKRFGMYASASTQTCIATFVVKGVQTAHKPSLDAESEAFLSSKGARITSFSCKAADGTIWDVSAGGVAKRIRGGAKSSANDTMAEVESTVDEPSTANDASIAMRLSSRKRTKAERPFVDADKVPQHLRLRCEQRGTGVKNLVYANGSLCVNQETRDVSFKAFG